MSFYANDQARDSLCIVESAQNDNKKVKITPWIDEIQNCHCNASITLDKDLIGSVSKTDLLHFCCGKKHQAIEVFFKKDASISVSDWIGSTWSARLSTHPDMLSPPISAVPPHNFSVNNPSFPNDESFQPPAIFQSRFPSTLPKCGWRKVVCGSALPGYPVPMCWEYYCYFPDSSRNLF